MNAIEARSVTRFFGVFAALRRLSFTVEAGDRVALLGRNGSGKSTLLRLLAGIHMPSEGNVSIFGEDPAKPHTRRLVGFLGHGSGLYDELSAEANLLLAAQLAGRADAEQAASLWMRRIDLERVARNSPAEFSRGMRQRLALARVLIGQPKLLLLDEPLTALDDRATHMVLELLQEAAAQGTTLLMSTHHLSEGMQLARSILLLDRGTLAYRGTRTEAMLADPGAVYSLCGVNA